MLRRLLTLLLAACLALFGVACEEDGTGIDEDVEQGVEQEVEEEVGGEEGDD